MSNFLLILINNFHHIDPKVVRDINEFGKVETVLAGFVGNDERFRPLEANRELRRGEKLSLSNAGEDFAEDGESRFVFGDEVHDVQSL